MNISAPMIKPINLTPLLATLFLLFSNPCYAVKSKKKCDSSELELKNCLLHTLGVKLHFAEDKILVHDGVWRTIEAIPLTGKLTEWKDIQLQKIGSQLYIEIWIWTEPSGDAEVQNLNWYILEINSRKLTLVFSESVQKRSRNLTFEKGHYFYDKALPHKLKEEKGRPSVYFKNMKKIISDK